MDIKEKNKVVNQLRQIANTVDENSTLFCLHMNEPNDTLHIVYGGDECELDISAAFASAISMSLKGSDKDGIVILGETVIRAVEYVLMDGDEATVELVKRLVNTMSSKFNSLLSAGYDDDVCNEADDCEECNDRFYCDNPDAKAWRRSQAKAAKAAKNKGKKGRDIKVD